MFFGTVSQSLLLDIASPLEKITPILHVYLLSAALCPPFVVTGADRPDEGQV